MKFLHRNKMREFYSSYSKHNTKHSEGEHHNTQHLMIMKEDISNPNISLSTFSDITFQSPKPQIVYPRVETPPRQRTSDTFDDLTSIASIETPKSTASIETYSELTTPPPPPTPSPPSTPAGPSTPDGLNDAQLRNLLISKGITQLRNPETGYLVNINGKKGKRIFSKEILLKHVKK